MALKRELSYFDLMNIVIGASIGSDIFIVPGITAGLIGRPQENRPASSPTS